MLKIHLKKNLCFYRKQKEKNIGTYEEFLARIAKSLYYVELPLVNRTSLPVTELASEIFSEVNKFSLNQLDLEKAAHLSQNGCISPALLVLAFLYLERLKLSNPKYLSQVSPTELFFISLIVGSKFLQDVGEGEELSNTEWADFTGLSVNEINKAEKQFLNAINWEVYVSKEEFWSKFDLLETKVGLKQGCRRGWFTYTELNILLDLIDFTTVVQCFWNVTTACLISYTASVLALSGSALLVVQIPGLKLKSEVTTTEVIHNDWAITPPSTFQFPCTKVLDCNASSSLEFTQETNATEYEFQKLCEGSLWSKKETMNPLRSINLYFFSGFNLHLPTENFLCLGNLIMENIKEGNPLFLLYSFDIWIWYDCEKLLNKNFGARGKLFCGEFL